MDTESSTHSNGQVVPVLDETTFETVSATILQVVGNTVPLVGAVSGLFLQEISGRRLKRFKLYIEVLNNKYENLEKLCHSHDTRLNLVEEGVYHATRAYSEERIKHIASIIANGISGKGKEETEASRMLKILAELEDEQIIVLAYYLDKNRDNEEFYNTHANVLEQKIDFIGGGIERSDEATMQETAKLQLVRLGLLQHIFKKPREGEIPDFDPKTGMIKASGYMLTWQGSMFLRYLGLAEPGEL